MRKTTLVTIQLIFFIQACLATNILIAGTSPSPTSAASLIFKDCNTISEKDTYHIFSNKVVQLCEITAPEDITGRTNDDGEGNCHTLISLGVPTLSNCAGLTAKPYINDVEIDPETYLFTIGTTIVIWRISDGLNILASDEQKVEIIDTEKPVITAPENITVNTDLGNCTASGVDLGTPITSDNCEVANISNDAPEIFPLGTTTVIWTATDAAGNSQATIQEVLIVDSEKPVITAPENITVNTDLGKCNASGADLGTPITSDNCEVAIISNDAPEIFPLGTTTVIWTATDAAGNSQTAIQEVLVVDSEKPLITAPENITVNTDPGNCTASGVDLGTPLTSDNCEVANISNDAPEIFPLGTTTVTWIVKDAAGNSQTATQNVLVVDNEDPKITAPADVLGKTSDDGTGNCTSTAILGTPLISDNCEILSVKAYVENAEINPSNYIFPIGSTTVRWTITDTSGNSASDLQEIIIEDDEAPFPPKLNNIVWGCTYNIAPPTAHDNCDPDVTVTANRSTNFVSSGVILWTFTDAAGNSSEVSQTVTINPLSATVSGTRTSVYEKNDGSANVLATGGVAPYSYEWRSTGSNAVLSTSQKATNLAAGTYEVTVFDANACSITKEIPIISAVRPDILASSECESVHDYIRTSTFQADLSTITGGIGDSENFKYQWDFGAGATPASGTGTDEFIINWDSEGDKVIQLTISDESNYSQTFSIIHYVGGCFEGCGTSVNFDLNTENFFIGDKFGNRLTGANCEQTEEKYLWIEITKNANGFGLSSELYYATNDGSETVSRKVIGCFEEIDDPSIPTYKPIPEGLFRLFQVQDTDSSGDKITWKCGETFKVLQLNIRWTNLNTRGCNQGTKPMCYGPNEEVIVHTPLMAEATSTNILCKGESSGAVTIRASGGQTPYQYSLTGPENRPFQSSHTFYNLPAGSYNYYVKDSQNNTTSGIVIINEPDSSISADISIIQPVQCFGGTGEAQVYAVGGTPPYTYSWSSGATSEKAIDLIADITYTVTITDLNGCTLTKPITLNMPPQLTTANAGINQTLGCGITSTALDANYPSSGEKGEWKIISGAGGILSELEKNNPKAPFTGTPGEQYVLEWVISNATDGSCPNSDQVSITISQECSTLNFDGVDDHVVVGDFYDFPSSEFSLEAWIRPKSINGTKTILSKRNTANFSSGGYDLSVINGTLSFRWNGNQVVTIEKISTNRWYHVAVIFRGSMPQLYVDGIQLQVQISIPNASNPKDISHPFLIGAAYYANTPLAPKSYFHGWIEEVRVWGKAISEEQLRFMMNQRLEQASNTAGTAVVKGEILPMNVPDDLLWANLHGYYRLVVTEIDSDLGTTPNIIYINRPGYLRNIEDTQENSAPLPYISTNNGSWWNKNSWAEPTFWDPPNSLGIDGTKIDWNIAYVSHELHSGSQNITLLGFLLKGGKLDMLGTNPTSVNQPGTGNALTISKYLDLDGFIDLNGESQLLQTEGSILAGSGRLDRDQQGTASSYNYNYFSSPVSTLGNSQNSGYTIAGVLRSGTVPNTPSAIHFNYQYHFADGPLSDPLKLSTYWMYKFHGEAGLYNEWQWIGQNGYLNASEGFTMKGTSGHKAILELQNYVFTGMPNNGNVSVNISEGQNRLIGNPYPSAIDADEFIKDNLEDRSGQNVFNGTLYFWSHFSGKTHYLQRYVGGYATYNLSGGVRAISNDTRINATGEIGGMEPQKYIPPGQAFFINTVIDESVSNWASKLPQPVGITGGEVKFNNSQRVFQIETPDKSVFHTTEKPRISNTSKTSFSSLNKKNEETRRRIWITATTPLGYHRQLLVTEDDACSQQFDIGYDAPLYDENEEDMFWDMNGMELVIQGIPEFEKETQLPFTVKAFTEGQFQISIEKLENIPENFSIHLKDTLKKETFDLRKGTFSFQAQKGTIKDRFSIVFLNEKAQKTQKEIEKSNPSTVQILHSNKNEVITILNPDFVPLENANIYTINGQLVRTYDFIPCVSKTELLAPLKTQGVYIFELKTAGTLQTLKFVVHK